jgi:predicted DNA-binding transcriptional regulator AlpA
MQTPKILLTEDEAAQLLGFTPRFLQQRRYRGDGPPFVRISARAVRYRVGDLQGWAAERIRTSTSE